MIPTIIEDTQRAGQTIRNASKRTEISVLASVGTPKAIEAKRNKKAGTATQAIANANAVFAIRGTLSIILFGKINDRSEDDRAHGGIILFEHKDIADFAI